MTTTPAADESLVVSGVQAQEFEVVQKSSEGGAILTSHPSSQNQIAAANFDLKSSTKSLVNSRKVLEKVQVGKYVGKSKAGNTHFSLTSNLINSNRSHKTQQK